MIISKLTSVGRDSSPNKSKFGVIGSGVILTNTIQQDLCIVGIVRTLKEKVANSFCRSATVTKWGIDTPFHI